LRAVISLVVAALASLAGLPALWIGGVQVMRSSQQFAGGGPLAAPGAAVLVLVGVLLIAAAAFSVRWSGVGAIAVGAAHVLGGVLAVLLPLSPFSGAPAPVWEVLFSFGALSRDLSDGAVIFTARGLGLLLGFLLIGAGVAVLGPRGAGGRVLAAVAGGIALLATIGIGLVQGSAVYRAYLIFFNPDVVAGALLILAALAAGAAALSLRWSGYGAVAAGGVLLAVGLVAALSPASGFGLPPAAATDLLGVAMLGGPQVLGAVLVALGIAAERRPAAVPAEAAPASTGPAGM
jgi:hypothetical protein